MNHYIILDLVTQIQNDIDLLPIVNLYLPNLSSKRLYLAPIYYQRSKKVKYENSKILTWGTVLHTLKECYLKYPMANSDIRDVIWHFIFSSAEYDVVNAILSHCRKGKLISRLGNKNLPPTYYYLAYIDILLQIAYEINDPNILNEISNHYNNVYKAFFGCLLKNFDSTRINDPNIYYLLHKLLNKLKPHFNIHNKLLGWAYAKSATPLVKLMIEDGATTCSNSLCYLSIAEHPLTEED